MNKKHTRFFSILFAAACLLSVFCLTGCGSSETDADSTVTQTPPTVSPNTDEANNVKIPERVNGVLTLSLGYSTKSNDPRGVASQQFKEEVESKTKGSVIINIFPEGQKGSDSELITSLIDGSIDMTVSSCGNFTGYSKNVGVSALPFLFNSFEDAWKFMDSSVSSEVEQDLLNYNIRVLAHFDNGFRCVTTKDKPINTPVDMIGLDIRTPDNAVVKETMSALGAIPRTLAFAELYNALASGQFDAQENPIPVIYNNKLYEVQHCLSITNHSYDAMPYVISNAAWKQMSEPEQKIVKEAAIAAQALDRNLVKSQSDEYIEKLRSECGMNITTPDLTAFKEKTKDVASYFSYEQTLLDSINQIIAK